VLKGSTPYMTVSPKKKKPVYAGLSISHREVELAVFSPKTMVIEQSFSLPLPDGLFDNEMDTVRDVSLLKEHISELLKQAKPRPTLLHISLPGTLLRMVEMPKMDASALYLSLSSEAERYKTFDHTEAAVDFVLVPNPYLPANMQQLVLGAIRSDVFSIYLKLFKELKIKPTSISLEPVNILRGMAASGVLDSLVQQIGSDSRWGMILVELGRVRFSLWQGDRLVELRELVMDTSEFEQAQTNGMVVEDLLEEMRRTTKNESPTVWLTSNMPAAMEQILSQRLDIPVRSAPMGNSIGMTQPLQLATLGVTTSSLVSFPFDLDIMEGMKSAGNPSSSPSNAPAAKVEESGAPDLFIPMGVVVLMLSFVATGILYAMGLLSGQGIPDLESKLEASKLAVSALQTREQELRSKSNLNHELQDVLKQAKARAHVYVALTDELKERTPSQQVWIQTLKIDSIAGESPMELDGRALNHQSVINFARSFDDVPYTKAVLIDSIKEGKLSGNLIYDFKISGSVNLAPVLSKIEAEKATQDAGSTSTVQSPAAKSGA
jgi:Tfp pilus assembly PilM family ATPase